MADGYRFFDEKTLATFRAAAACIVPSEPDSPGADAEPALRLADRALSERPRADRRLLTAFLRAVEWLPLLRYGRPFSKLRREQRDAVLSWLENNRVTKKFRQGFFGLKTFALLGYYGSELAWQELGYPGPRLDAPYYQLRRSKTEGGRG